MKNNRKLLYIIITSVIIGAVMELTEYAAHQFGLELRTFAQSIKGIYLWLIMPLILLFTANIYVKFCFNKAELKQNADIRLLKALNLLREIAVVILFIGICAAAFFRGMFYVFTSEMVTEEIMADGYIQGEFADFLSESYYEYYAPVAAIFREPFTGWSEEELVDKVHEKYSGRLSLWRNRRMDGMYLGCRIYLLMESIFIFMCRMITLWTVTPFSRFY